MHTVSGPRHHPSQFLGFSAVDLAAQGDHTFTALYLYRRLLRRTAPQQTRTDDGSQGGILKTLSVSPQFERALDQPGVDLQLVIDLLDASSRLCDVFGQLTLNLILDLTRQACPLSIHLDLNAKRVEHAIERQRRL
ncbi:hypothetical protein D3C81_1778790 [compost metagenome]